MEKVINITSKFREQEYKLAEHLKTMNVKTAAEKMGKTPKHIYQILYRMRNKIDDARDTSNVAANWMKHKRLARLLRRQE